MRQDFDQIEDGTTVILYPNERNPLHKKPVKALYDGGYFFCEGTTPTDGPDYYMGDVFSYNKGFKVVVAS